MPSLQTFAFIFYAVEIHDYDFLINILTAVGISATFLNN